VHPDIKTTTFEWFWSGNWPAFDLTNFFSEAYQQLWKDRIGRAPQVWMTFLEEGVTVQYFGTDDQEAVRQALVRAYEANPAIIQDTLSGYEERLAVDTAAIEELMQEDVTTCTNAELIEKLKLSLDHLQYNRFIDHYDFFCENKLQTLVEAWLQTKVPAEEVGETLTLITRPQRESPYARERKAFFALLDVMKKNTDLVQAIKRGENAAVLNAFPEKKLLEDHLVTYGCMRVVVNANPWTIEDLWPDIKAFVGEDKPYEIEETRPGDRYDPKLIEQANQRIRELNPEPNMETLIRGIQRAVYLRCLDNWDQGYTTTLLRPLYEEIAKRIGVTYQQFKCFTHAEIIDVLEKNETIPPEYGAERWKLTTYCRFNGEIILCTGTEGRAIKDVVTGKKKEEQRSTFTGTPAVPGTYTGKARVIHSLKDAEHVTKGEILLAPTTSAYFVPHMRRAAAIVTERGGVTNHAAIVAREQGIPCVVNVRAIMHHVQTGDLIEVDGVKGTVTILERS